MEVRIRYIALWCRAIWLGWLLSSVAFAQHALEILHADRLQRIFRDGRRIEVLIGNVVIRHGAVELRADSIQRWVDHRRVAGWGNVRLIAHDTLRVDADSFYYWTAARQGTLYGNVLLQTPTLSLSTSRALVDMLHQRVVIAAAYEVRHPDFQLAARWGLLRLASAHFTARDSVKVILSDAIVYTDTLEYDHSSRWVKFPRSGSFQGRRGRLYFGRGAYSLASRVGYYGGGVCLQLVGGLVAADSLYIHDSLGYSQWFGNVCWTQANGRVVAVGDSGWIANTADRGYLRGDVLLHYVTGADTLWARAAVIGWEGGGRFWKIHHSARLLIDSIGIVADSIWGDTAARIWKFFPVVVRYADFVGMADSAVWNTVADSLILHDSVWIRQLMPIPELFHQIQGSRAVFRMNNNTFRQGCFTGNVEAVYYLLDDSNRLGGWAHVISDSALIWFGERGSIQRFNFFPAPQVTVAPPPRNSSQALFLSYARPMYWIPAVTIETFISDEKLILLHGKCCALSSGCLD